MEVLGTQKGLAILTIIIAIQMLVVVPVEGVEVVIITDQIKFTNKKEVQLKPSRIIFKTVPQDASSNIVENPQKNSVVCW